MKNKAIENMKDIPTLGQAYWNQRERLSGLRDRILMLSGFVNKEVDLHPYQWAQLMAFAFEYSPDLILELGRGHGNSTCAFTEVANQLTPNKCRVISICDSDKWRKKTYPRLVKGVSEEWFHPLTIIDDDILSVDYESHLSGFERILVFWDAHGFDVAECVLGKILPIIHKKSHAVIMHDIHDTNYWPPDFREYGGQGLWRGGNYEAGRLLCLNNLHGCVDQIVAILDFISRNDLLLHSADHSLHQEIGNSSEKTNEMKGLLGEELFSLMAHWFWFSLYGEKREFTFPQFTPLRKKELPFPNRVKLALKMLLGRSSRRDREI
ncbi:hypothetical protein ACFLRC_00305 [Candidatus Altiarchaeota archaeon]